MLRSGSSSNFWGLTHIQTFFEVREEKIVKSKRTNFSIQISGVEKAPRRADWPSWVVNMLLTLRKFVQASLNYDKANASSTLN